MKSINKIFKEALIDASKKSYDHIVVAVDLHGTLVDSDLYNKWDGSEEDKLSRSIYHSAIPALLEMTNHPSVTMYIYSSTKAVSLLRIKNALNTLYGIFINISPGLQKESKSQDFSRKPYYSVLLDNKAGFDPNQDWDDVAITVKNLPVI